MAQPVLWQYNFSNFNEKTRWALDYKGVAHTRRSLLPNMPRALYFSVKGTVPVLDIDGERIVDSTKIIAALEQRYPEPALYPADPSDRERALELEEFFDEHAGHEVRRALFYEQRGNPGYLADFLTTGRGPATKRVFRALLSIPGAMSYPTRRYRFYAPDAEQAEKDIATALDRLTAELQPSGYLVGDQFSVADLTAASLIYPLAWPPELQYDYPPAPESNLIKRFADHPGIAYIREMFRRHRGTSMSTAG